MRPTLSSLTALLVAGARGLPRDVGEEPADPLASRMLPGLLGALVREVGRRSRNDRTLVRLLPTLSLGLVDHISLRTLAIDAACERAVAAGAEQLVVLGAGFDSRAYRLACLQKVDVFEVDHPATSAVKAARTRSLPVVSRSLARVVIDFERDDLDVVLTRAGHDTARPTAWIWEGVTMYLTNSAIDGSLGVIARRSSAGSTLIMSYGTPDFAPPVYLAVLKLAGEPLCTLLTPAQVAAKLDDNGLLVVSDDGSADWLARFGGGGWIVGRERVVVGRMP